MKIKHGIFKKLTGEPDLVQDLGDRTLAIYWMDDTPYYTQYTSQGRFALWTSNGKEYKLLVAKGYYESVSDIYTPKANTLWVNYLVQMGKTQFKYNIIFYLASLVIIAVVVLLAILLKQQMIALIGLIVVLILSMIQNGVLRRKIQVEGDRLQYNLMNEIGEDKFKEVINCQQEYYTSFFQKNEPISDKDEPISDESVAEDYLLDDKSNTTDDDTEEPKEAESDENE